MRIEHRVVQAGPTIIDNMANAAFYYGLVGDKDHLEGLLPFKTVQENFYTCAQQGLNADIIWSHCQSSKWCYLATEVCSAAWSEHGRHEWGYS